MQKYYKRRFFAVISAAAGLCLPFFLAGRTSESQGEKTFYQSPGTKKMAALLEKIYEEEDWKTDPNKDGERAEYYMQMLQAGPDLRNELKIRQALADRLLRAGDSAGAVEQLEGIRKLPSGELF